MNKIIIFIITIIFFNCSIPSYRLLQDGDKVPKQGYKFKKSNKFDPSIYDKIDPNYLYICIEEYTSGNNFKELSPKEKSNWPFIYQFYSNGSVRRMTKFSVDKDPNCKGNRGVVYKNKRGNICIDMYDGVGDGFMQIVSYKVRIEDEKLYIMENIGDFAFLMGQTTQCLIFQKWKEVPQEWKQYTADW